MMSLQYIAGFVDGEGCIQFAKCRNSVYPRVLVVNTNKDILEELKARFGGDIKPLSLRLKGWKQGWQWRISWKTAVSFLEKLQPYLRLKVRQMETVFAWDTVRPGTGNSWDRDTLNLLVSRMSWLNAKGPIVDVDPAIEGAS